MGDKIDWPQISLQLRLKIGNSGAMSIYFWGVKHWHKKLTFKETVIHRKISWYI